MNGWAVCQDAIVGFTFCWIFSVIFTTLRRYLLARANAALQDRVLQRIDSSESMLTLVSSDSGREFLNAITMEKTPAQSPFSRILFGVQAGIVLIFFGIAMLFLHHHTADQGSGFIIFGTGAIGLGLGFLIAAGASIAVSRRLGLLNDSRG